MRKLHGKLSTLHTKLVSGSSSLKLAHQSVLDISLYMASPNVVVQVQSWLKYM